MTGATDRKPWAGETQTLPPRVGGRRIVAAVKLMTGTGRHQWAVVLELPGDLFVNGLVTQSGSRLDVEMEVPVFSYPTAVDQMLGRFRS